MKASAACVWRLVLVVALARGGAALAEDEPLHSLVDKRLTILSSAPQRLSSDAEFLRRVSLDLAGMPPTSDEAREFLADTAADKRVRLIDRLFASPHFVRHLATTLDLMLMERRAFTNVTADEWQAWLMNCVRQNKPWNVLAREILEADGDDPALRPAARFSLDRASEAHLLTRDIGRIFFGRDMQCAQCHDHPLVSDYLQSDYQGLLAFMMPTYAIVRKDGDKQTTLQAEKPGTDITFESVFVGTPRRTGARMPDGVAIDEPFYLPGEEYEVAPAENVKSVPKFSRRKKLAELATSGANEAFNRNIVNRLWAHMFGRGLVSPVDMQHPENPAVDPELLEMLSERFAAMNFDIRRFLREIALTSAYQRAYDLPSELVSLSAQAAADASRLEAEREALNAAAAASDKAYRRAAEAWEQAEATMIPMAAELDTARTKYAEAKQKVDEAVKAAGDAKTQHFTRQAVAASVAKAAVAAKQAAQALVDDQELADAAQKIVARSEQLAAESVALAKMAEEKSAAVQAPTDAWHSTKPVVEGARSKVTPLANSLRQAEQAMYAARCKAASDAEALAAVDRRVETVRCLAQLEKLNQTLVSAAGFSSKRESELAAAGKELAGYAAVIADHRAKLATLTEQLPAAAAALAAATEEFDKRKELAAVLLSALSAADSALQKLPNDGELANAVRRLQERADLARVEAEEVQRRAEGAAAAHKSAGEALAAAQVAMDAAIAERARHEQAVNLANSAWEAARAELATKQSAFDSAVAELVERWTDDFSIAQLKPLTPEQLCWSVFRVTGVYDRYWQAEVAELDKTKALSEEQKKDATQLAARDFELEQRTYDKLKGNIGTFVAYYGAAAGQPQGDFFSTADQALFVENGGSVNSWVATAGGNVTERIVTQSSPRAAAEVLYLAVLTRMPTEEEAAEVVSYLASRGDDKNAAAQELVWGLLNSAEFRFNH